MMNWLTGIVSDVRIAARALGRNPGFTAVAVVTLAIGLGGATAVYTLLERVVLDPLPYPEPDRLVELTNRVPGVSADGVWSMSTAQYVYFAERARTFDAIGLYRGYGANIDTPEGAKRVSGWLVTASVFPMLGARARYGRVITPADDRPGSPDVVVLSFEFWRNHLGEDPGIVGRTLSIDGRPQEVIGVLDPGVRIPGSPPGAAGDFWSALRIDPDGPFHNNHVFPMLGRLAATADVAQAELELERLTAELPGQFPQAYSPEFFERYGFRTQVVPLREAMVGTISESLWILFGAVGLVLVIAAANVANLFLIRMDGREREFAVRTALGAGRWTVARHVLAEGMVLAVAGGALAVLVGLWGVPALVALAPTLPRIDTVGMNGGSVAFTALVSLVTGLGIAAWPLIRHPARTPSRGLAGAGRSLSAGRERQRLRAGLVIAQVALALTLVAASGLLIESMRRLNRASPGMDPEGVLTAELYLTPVRYADDVAIWTTYREILDRVRAIPGVLEAGLTEELPTLGGFGCTVQGFEDARVYDRLQGAGMTTCAGQEPTSPGYFEAAGIPVLQGRTFTDRDNDAPGTAAAVVSRAFAERFWPGEDPIGKGLAPSGRTEGPFYHVIGVVGDVPAGSLDGPTAIAVYYPIVQDPATPENWGWWMPTDLTLVVRTGLADPVAIAAQVRRAVEAVDPTIPLANIRDMDRVIAVSTARIRFTSILLGIAAAIALLLAAIGLYGVIAYVVSKRTREIGIRIAIGAAPSAVSREVVGRSFVLVAAGVAVGVGLSLLLTRLMEGLLYGVEPTDPVAFVAAALLLVTVAGIASWVPARRAARVDPVVALRIE